MEDHEMMLAKAKNILSTELDGETIILSIESGEYFSLNRVGSLLWKSLDTPQYSEQLIENIITKQCWPESEADVIRHELAEFLNQLIESQLICHE